METSSDDRVVVCRSIVTVLVAIPPDVSPDAFDEAMIERYGRIADAVDVRDAIQVLLTDKGGPLEGYDVRVEVT